MCNLKFVLAFLSFVVFVKASASEMKKYDACLKQYPIDDANKKSLMEKGVLVDETVEMGRCFIECVMEDVEKTLGSNDIFDAVKAKKNIPIHGKCLMGPPGTAIPAQALIDAAVDECGKLSEAGKCMTNYRIWTCLAKKLRVQKV